MFFIKNEGQAVARTDYWRSVQAQAGYVYLNRKLSDIPGMVDRCRQVLHISVHSTGKRRAGFPQHGTFPDNGAGYRHASRR